MGTMNGAYASFEENQKGSITAGKLADLVVLGHDPLRVDPMSLIEVPIERTMVGGAGSTNRSSKRPLAYARGSVRWLCLPSRDRKGVEEYHITRSDPKERSS